MYSYGQYQSFKVTLMLWMGYGSIKKGKMSQKIFFNKKNVPLQKFLKSINMKCYNSSKVLILIVLTVFFVSCGNRKAKEGSKVDEISIRLPIPVVNGDFVPYYLAQDKGIFEKYGLNVKLEPGSPELNPVKMIGQGVDQFGIVGGPELLMTARSNNVAIKAIGLVHVNANFVTILTKKGSPYTKLTDLQGQKVGFNYGHISTDVLRSLFVQENIKVEEVDVGFNYNLFLADKLPAQWAFTTTAGLTLRERDFEFNDISTSDYGINTHGHTIITNEKLINEKPDLVKRFVSAVIEATKYSLEHVDESIEAMQKRDKDFSASLAQKQLAIINPTILNNSKVLWIDASLLADTKNRLIRLGLISENFDLNAAFDNSFLKEYYKVK